MACEVCKKTYVSPTDDNSFDFDRKPHLCKICGRTFALKKQLKGHLTSHEGNAPFTCNTCEKNHSSSYNLRMSKQGNFVCETCYKCFTTKRLLLRHAGEHTQENVLNCDECGETFKNMTALKKHLTVHKPNRNQSKTVKRKHSDDEPPSYQCEECGKFFTKLKPYETHCLNHKKYHCLDCNVYFASNKLLKEHLASGSCHLKLDTSQDSSISSNVSNSNLEESKKNTCDFCKKSFTRKSAFEGHMLTHFMENHESPIEDDSDLDVDFQCNLNDEKSNELCLPKLKIRRSFDCKKCSSEFSSKLSLNKHMLSHDEKSESAIQVAPELKKTYTCRQCQATFNAKETYRQHKSSHDESNSSKEKEESNHTCQICLKVFAKKKHFKKHIKMHLEDDSTTEQKLSLRIRTTPLSSKIEKRPKNFSTDSTDDSNISCAPTEEKSNFPTRTTCQNSKKEKRPKNFSTDSTDDSNFSGAQTEEKSNSQTRTTCQYSKKEKRPKNFSCGYCGKLFVGETCWKKHEAKHDGEIRDDDITKGKKGKKPKLLICEFCNEDFTGKRQLYVKHKHSHTPEVCGICDARFVDRATLREHCRVHIGTEEGRRFLECSQKVLDAKNGVVAQQEAKVEYIYLVLR